MRVVSVWVGRVMVVVGGHRIKAVKKRVYLKAAADNNIYICLNSSRLVKNQKMGQENYDRREKYKMNNLIIF